MIGFEYRVASIVGPGLISLENGDPAIKPGNRLALWRPVKVHQDQECAITAQKIPKGALAWRPTTNALFKFDRISNAGMGHLCFRAALVHPGMGRE